MRLLERRAPREARTYAEAQGLVDDGYPLEEVLRLFPADADWLAALLSTSSAVAQDLSASRPDPAFARSLHDAFLAAARRPSFVGNPAPAPGRLRTSFAAATVAAAVGSLGVLAYGMVTADDAGPGDWNYTLRTTRERIEGRLGGSDSTVDVQIRETEQRVQKLQQLTTSGELSLDDLARFERQARELADLVRERPLDDSQKARVRGILEGANTVLDQASQQRPELQPAVTSTRKTVEDAVAAAGGGAVTSISEPAPTNPASPEPSPSPTSQATPEGSATPEPTATTPATEPGGLGGVTPIAVPSPAPTGDE